MRRRISPAVCLFAALSSLTTSVALAEAAQPSFRAGAAIADITPDVGVSMDGTLSKPGAVRGVHDRLHARALVLDDGTTRLAIVVCDACYIGRDVFDAAKAIVQKSSQLASDRILISATHTHAAPRAIHIGVQPADEAYHKQLSQQIAAAIIDAEANLAPALVGYGSFDKPELVQCRRSLCEPGSVAANPFGETGELIKSVAGSSKQVIGPAGPVDPQFSLLSIQHADGSPLAVLGNYSVHYCGGYQAGLVSADYFGHFAEALQAELFAGPDHPPFVAIMSNGTSGDTGGVNSGGKKYPPFEWMQVSARILANDAAPVLEAIEYRSDVTLQMVESELTLAVRRPDAERVQWARTMLALPKSSHPHAWTQSYAQEALHLQEYPATVAIKMQAIRIGDTGIAAIPCEVFAETGLAIKDASPLAHTFTMELANGYGGYLPTARQHELGGYETWPARSSFLEVDAETKIRAEAIKLLKTVAPQENAAR